MQLQIMLILLVVLATALVSSSSAQNSIVFKSAEVVSRPDRFAGISHESVSGSGDVRIHGPNGIVHDVHIPDIRPLVLVSALGERYTITVTNALGAKEPIREVAVTPIAALAVIPVEGVVAGRSVSMTVETKLPLEELEVLVSGIDRTQELQRKIARQGQIPLPMLEYARKVVGSRRIFRYRFADLVLTQRVMEQ
jgi:hypothetical protein